MCSTNSEQGRMAWQMPKWLSFTHHLWWDNMLVNPQIFLQNVPLCCQVTFICTLQEYRLSNRLIPKPFSKTSAIPDKEQGITSMQSWNTSPSFLEGGEERGGGEAKSVSPLGRAAVRTCYASVRFITVAVSAAVVPCPKHQSIRGSELSLSSRTCAGHPWRRQQKIGVEPVRAAVEAGQLQPTSPTAAASKCKRAFWRQCSDPKTKVNSDTGDLQK